MISISTITENIKTIKTAMKRRRIALDLSQEDAARKSGIALATLRRFEQVGEISLERLVCLMKLYGMDRKIIPSFENMDWWSLEEIKRAESRQKA
jgi:transcriptional regulator with XRE-family HTH domain